MQVENRGGWRGTSDLLRTAAGVNATDCLKPILDLQPDVVHVHNTWFRLGADVLRELRRFVPVVVTLHNYRLECINGTFVREGNRCTDCLGVSPAAGIRHACYRDSYGLSVLAAAAQQRHRARRTYIRDVDALVVPSSTARDLLIQGELVDPERVHVVPHPIAMPVARSQHPAESNMLLVVGRLSPEKAPQLAADAFVAWKRTVGSPLTLAFVGQGPEHPRLAALADSGVRLLGHLPHVEVLRLLGSARGVVSPGPAPETFSFGVAEAVAAGLPVLARNGGAAAGLVPPTWLEHWPLASDRQEWQRGLTWLGDDSAVSRAHEESLEYRKRRNPAEAVKLLSQVYDAATIRWDGRKD